MERFNQEEISQVEELTEQVEQIQTFGLSESSVSSDVLKTLETFESDKNLPIAFLNSCRNALGRITKIAAMTAILSGTVGDVFARENKPETKSDGKNENTVEQVQSKEVQERTEDLIKINDICKEHGLDFIDATSPFLEVHLPKEGVKKVVVHIGQTHAIEAYEDSSRVDRKEVIESQKRIYDILRQAHLKSEKPQICLQEGFTTNEEVLESLNDEKTHGDFRTHALDIASNPSIDINATIKAEIKAVVHYSIINKNSGLKDAGLFDMSRSIQKILLEEKVNEQTRERLIQMNEFINDHVDTDVLIYTIGGALMAGKLEHAILKPAESEEENTNVAKKICKDIGVPFDENEGFYAVINKLPKAQKQKAYSLVSKYGLSKERERPVMNHAENALKQTKLVFINFGSDHRFEDVLEEEWSRDEMKGVALIKLDLNNFEKVDSRK